MRKNCYAGMELIRLRYRGRQMDSHVKQKKAMMAWSGYMRMIAAVVLLRTVGEM